MLVWRLTLYQKRGGNALFAETSRGFKVFEQKTGGVFDTTGKGMGIRLMIKLAKSVKYTGLYGMNNLIIKI